MGPCPPTSTSWAAPIRRPVTFRSGPIGWPISSLVVVESTDRSTELDLHDSLSQPFASLSRDFIPGGDGGRAAATSGPSPATSTHQVRTSLPFPLCGTDHPKPSVSYLRPDLAPLTRLCSAHAGSRSCYDGSYPSAMVRSAPLLRDPMICALVFWAGRAAHAGSCRWWSRSSAALDLV
jgi:hypothetical protein